MKPWYKRTVVRAAIFVLVIQTIYYTQDRPDPTFTGWEYPESTTRPQKSRGNESHKTTRIIQQYEYSGGTCGVGDIISDFSEYREQQLKRGYTEDQIDDQLRKEVRKLLDQRRINKTTYEQILDKGLDPEYDLDELDEGLLDEID